MNTKHTIAILLIVALLTVPVMAQTTDGSRTRTRTIMGIKAQYLILDGNEIHLKLSRYGEYLGDVHYTRTVDEIVTSFSTPSVSMVFRDIRKEDKGSEALYLVYQGREIALTGPDASEAEVSTVMWEIGQQADLQLLLAQAGVFLSRDAVLEIAIGSIIVPPADESEACLEKTLECILAAAAYVGGIGGLISLCGFSFGISCVMAILIHPVLALTVGVKCSGALKACGVK